MSDSPTEYPLKAKLWLNPATNEWVLTVQGEVNGIQVSCDHAAPAGTNPADVPTLSHLDPEGMSVLVPDDDHSFSKAPVNSETVTYNKKTRSYYEYAGDDYLEDGDIKKEMYVVR